MTPSRFCPKCGATDKGLFKGFCVECYLSDHPGVLEIPSRIELEYCHECLRNFVHGEWSSGHEDTIHELIRSKVRTELENLSVSIELNREQGKVRFYNLVVEGTLGGEKVMLEREVGIRMIKRQCPVCARKDSTYYEALVQLRPKGNEIDLDRLKSALNFLRNANRALIKDHREAEVFRYERVKNGVNVYFGSAKAAKKALQAFVKTYDCETKETYTLVGVNKANGKRRYKVTISVKL